MFEIASAVILYVFGFPCLYGVLRLAVRHGLEDAARLAQEDQTAPRPPALAERAVRAGG